MPLHVTRATCGQAHFFSIRFPRYATSLACMGQDWIAKWKYWRVSTRLLETMMCWKLETPYHDETYIIGVFFWDCEFQPFQSLLWQIWSFKLNNYNLCLVNLWKGFQPLPWKIWAFRVKLSCRNRSVLQLGACLRRVKTPHHRTSCTSPWFIWCVCVYVDLKRDKRCKSVYIHKNIYGVFFVWRQNQPCQQ